MAYGPSSQMARPLADAAARHARSRHQDRQRLLIGRQWRAEAPLSESGGGAAGRAAVEVLLSRLLLPGALRTCVCACLALLLRLLRAAVLSSCSRLTCMDDSDHSDSGFLSESSLTFFSDAVFFARGWSFVLFCSPTQIVSLFSINLSHHHRMACAWSSALRCASCPSWGLWAKYVVCCVCRVCVISLVLRVKLVLSLSSVH